jgi:hypothetical protein
MQVPVKLSAYHKEQLTDPKTHQGKPLKLRACLQKKGASKLSSTSSRAGQRLMRHVKQEINRAVNQCFIAPEHTEVQFAYEQLSVASMRFKARAQKCRVSLYGP